MSNQIKGAKPISEKRTAPVGYDDVYANALSIPEDIKKEIDSKGLKARWINATDFTKMGGYNKAGWVPFKSEFLKGLDLKFGTDPSGILRRGDMILAVKTHEQVARQRQYLDNAANRKLGQAKQNAEELRTMLKTSGIKGKVLEGYEENE